MSSKTTYSFLDVNAAIVGPGGAIPLGAGSGNAEEGISVETAAELGSMTIGADGAGVHSLHADRSGKVTIRLLKTSPINALLNAMKEFQRVSASTHGANTLTITNKVSGDVITCEQTGFARDPANAYGKLANVLEWEFNSIKITQALGAGIDL